MAINDRDPEWPNDLSDADLAAQTEAMMLRVVEGHRDANLDAEYVAMRRALMQRAHLRNDLPSWIVEHRSLQAMWPFWKNFASTWAERRAEVSKSFNPLIEASESKAVEAVEISSSTWTGATNLAEKTRAIRTLGPAAMAATETLISFLEQPNHNGGPPLDAHLEALTNLQQFHKLLGDLLAQVESQDYDPAHHNRALIEATRYAKRAARALRDDPMPYAVATGIFISLAAFGQEGLGGLISGMALNLRKIT